MPLRYSLLPLLLCMTVVGWQAFSADPHNTGRDFMHNGWIPARLILDGQDPYNPDQQEVRRIAGNYLGTLLAEGGQVYNTGRAYNAVYPYWVELLQLPLGLLDYPTALIVWILLGGAALMAGLFLAMSGARRRLAVPFSPLQWAITLLLFGLLALTFAPSILHMALGQYSVFILFLFALLYATSPQQEIIPSLVLAFATMKLQIAALVIALVLLDWLRQRQWRRLIIVFSAVAGLNLAPLIYNPAALSNWFTVNFMSQKQAIRAISAAPSWWGVADDLNRNSLIAIALPLSLLTLALLLPQLRGKQDAVAALPLTLIVSLLVTFYTFSYDQVLLIIPFVYLWMRLQNRGGFAAVLRISLMLWITLLPLLAIVLSEWAANNCVRIVQTLALLGLYYLIVNLKVGQGRTVDSVGEQDITSNEIIGVVNG